MYIISLVCRYMLCLIPYMILVSNKQIIYHITGPITIPPFNQSKGPLIYWIGAIQFFRVFYYPIAFILLKFVPNKSQQTMNKRKYLLTNMCVKYGIVLLMKLFIIFYQIHRLKYYLHVFFLQLLIMAVNILADVVNNHKVSLVMDIVLIDSLNRVAIFYQLTRTFNPNFGLYFFGNNLITLICYMLQGERKLVLYVRHDIYRIMIVTMGYLCMFSLFQLSVSYRPLIIFVLSGYFFFQSIQQLSHEQIRQQENNVINNNNRNKGFNFGDLRQYINKMGKKVGLLSFLMVIGITIGVQLLFIYNQQNNQEQILVNKSEYILNKSEYLVKNTFMQFYNAMKINQSIRD